VAEGRRAAFNLGQLVGAGLLDAEQVGAVLLEAAMAAPATGHADRERKARALASLLRPSAIKPKVIRLGDATRAATNAPTSTTPGTATSRNRRNTRNSSMNLQARPVADRRPTGATQAQHPGLLRTRCATKLASATPHQ
jgi:hypothetical protein